MQRVDLSALEKALEENPNLILLDVRTYDEYEEKHIENVVHIPLSELPSRANELAKDGHTIVLCAHGARAERAAHFLSSKGFTNVSFLADSVEHWHKFNLSLVTNG